MKQITEQIFVSMNFAKLAQDWPVIAEVYTRPDGELRRLKIEGREYSRQCDLKELMRSLLQAENARHVVCSKGAIVFCSAIKVNTVKGSKAYRQK